MLSQTDAELIRALAAWYDANKRDLPWRRTTDPYRIWISEIMLQQTRVEAVRAYYRRFLEALPRIKDLAEVPEEELLKLWEGLGYYSRARNLKKAAETVMDRYDGLIPSSKEELQKLPGIGSYTAGAVASIAFCEKVPAVDGNVLRVFARFFGDGRNILEPAFKKDAEAVLAAILSDPLFPDILPGTFNQALIELGATLCGPDRPADCAACPLNARCAAFAEGRTDTLPLRIRKSGRRTEQLTVLVIRDGALTAIRKRPAKGLLAGMYELPHLVGFVTAADALAFVREKGYDALYVKELPPSRHLFTHIEWQMKGFEIRISAREEEGVRRDGLLFADPAELRDRYALPSAFSAYTRYLKEI